MEAAASLETSPRNQLPWAGHGGWGRNDVALYEPTKLIYCNYVEIRNDGCKPSFHLNLRTDYTLVSSFKSKFKVEVDLPSSV